MAFVHVFCFTFSLRLGALITGTLSMVFSIIIIFLLLNFDWNSDVFVNELHTTLRRNELLNTIFENIYLFEELSAYFIGLIIFYLVMMTSSATLLIGAYQCKPGFIYQYLFFYIIDIALFCVYLIIFYQFTVMENDPLGTILYISMSFSVMLFRMYTWICIYSLIRVIQEVQKRLARQLKNPLKYRAKK